MSDTLFQQGKILIVDDERIDVRFLRTILERAGYTSVHSTTVADEALNLFRTVGPDLVLLDLAMPYRDGFAVMKDLLAASVGDPVPILVLTADPGISGRRKALQSGASDFLTKPLDDVEVLLRIRNLLQTRFHRVLLEEKVKEAQLFLQSTFDALTSHVAVLDEAGKVLAVNRAWQTYFVTSGGIGASCSIGDNYIAVCEQDDDCRDPQEVAQGIRKVMTGECPDFSLEYPCESSEGRLWFAVSITRFVAEEHVRVVVSHENVTQRRRAEEEVLRLAEQHFEQQRALTDRFIATLEEERRVQRLLTHRIITALEEERRAISFELHDGLTQYVMSSFAFFEAFAATVPTVDSRVPIDLQKGLKYLQDAVVEARRMVNGLRSLALDELGLVGALEQLLNEEAERMLWEKAPLIVPIPIPRFDPMLETAAYRVVQEALSNIRKHAATKRVAVSIQMIHSLDKEKWRLKIEVQDWGKGFIVSEKRESYSHVGLHSMAERVHLLQGTMQVESKIGEGTRIVAEFPVETLNREY